MQWRRNLPEREATLAKSQEELFSLRQFKSQHAPHLAEREGLIVVLADRIAALRVQFGEWQRR